MNRTRDYYRKMRAKHIGIELMESILKERFIVPAPYAVLKHTIRAIKNKQEVFSNENMIIQ